MRWYRVSRAISGRNSMPASCRSHPCWSPPANTAFRPIFGARCVRISELEGKRVAIWGYGREGRAALAALRWRLPRQPITVFCSDAEAPAIEAMEDPGLTVDTRVDGEK